MNDIHAHIPNNFITHAPFSFISLLYIQEKYTIFRAMIIHHFIYDVLFYFSLK